MTLAGIVENLISDFIFLLIAIALGWILFVRTRRAQLLRFFGISASRRIVVYLSNLRVIPGGAVGVDGQRRSYQGSATAFGEMLVANRFRDLFNYFLPSLSDKPGALKKLLISDVHVGLLSSPLDQGQLERSSSFITLGGPAYNAASSFVETELHSQARFRLGRVNSDLSTEMLTRAEASDDESLLTLTTSLSLSGPLSSALTPASSSVPSSITCLPMDEPDSQADAEQTSPAILIDGVPPITDAAFGFVERIVDHEQKKSVFYAAGLSELGTVGAAHFLAAEWARMYRRYGGNTSFAIMLRIEPTDFRRWSIVFERGQAA